MTAPVIFWFRQDLRLLDNPALATAAASGRPVVPVYILDDDAPGRWQAGGASRWWLHHSLTSLGASLSELGNALVLRHGAASDVLPRLIAETGADAIYFARRYEPDEAAADTQLAENLKSGGIACRRFGGRLLLEPEAIETNCGRPYQVFTPFHKCFLSTLSEVPVTDRPASLSRPATFPRSDRLDDWRLLPRAPDWAGGLRGTWSPGEDGALARLETFLDGAVNAYDRERDFPDRQSTSLLSPHLHFGEVSPRLCWQRTQLAAMSADSAGAQGCQAFLRQLVWREFCYHLLHHWPLLPDQPLRQEYAAFPWRQDRSQLKAWQRGQTGYPIVDAGMRQLWRIGWMHNRVRMIVASFLIKDLLIPWQAGEAWFRDTLVDADLANNSAGWQWVAGCGTDAAPFFRIFNPVTQAERFDPEGAYVRQWVPEIAGLPDRFVHRPWKAPAEVLKDAGIELGKTYPKPLVDHLLARRRALEAFAKVKKSGRETV